MTSLLRGLAGCATGALAAGLIKVMGRGDAPGFVLFGYCIGLGEPGCSGVPGGFYVFPGLTFGVVFGIVLLWRRRLRMAGAATFATVSTLANATAVIAWTIMFAPVGFLLGTAGLDEIHLLFAVTGAIAGAVGGGLLGFCALRLLGESGWLRATEAGAALGLLPPLLPTFPGGDFVFYALWQGGYAASLPMHAAPRPGAQAMRTDGSARGGSSPCPWGGPLLVKRSPSLRLMGRTGVSRWTYVRVLNTLLRPRIGRLAMNGTSGRAANSTRPMLVAGAGLVAVRFLACLEQQSPPIVRFWCDDGACWGIPFHQVLGTHYNPKHQSLLIQFALGTIVVTGPKAWDFYGHFCKNKATLLKADGQDITAVTMAMNFRRGPDDE